MDERERDMKIGCELLKCPLINCSNKMNLTQKKKLSALLQTYSRINELLNRYDDLSSYLLQETTLNK
ncbi:CLUMA_CG016727, isoform A [Clunio marinus]|uniref:CLUMA_CG016727, isoform A n=1 Tax=Clunio marinus TaxID=568069 RepID=A0A1J1IX87_9DIPT|nr:CLUMA_CG016727, isoform A [Clunio marinus]